jgi:outer membrane protein assembly factor BamB
MKVSIRYPALVATAMVAAVFSLIVGLLMALDFAGRGKYELFDTPAYVELKQQLRDRPGDEQVQQAIRELDLQLRDKYFRNRRFMAMGMHMALGGMVLALLAARWAVTLRGARFQPGPIDPETDAESLAQRYARWATVGVVAIVAAVLCGFALRAEPVAPAGQTQVASAATAQPPVSEEKVDGAAAHPQPTNPHPSDPEAADARPANPQPDIAPQSTAALPTYDEYSRQWPRFRGPTGAGVSPFSDIPAAWSVPDNTGILWQTVVPLPGPNSPIVWKERVFLSGATPEEQAVFCFDATSGQLQWRFDVPPTHAEGRKLEVMEATTYAAPTMATDGLRVYAIFATGDVVALNLAGQELWHKNLGVPKNHYGHASSLATYNDLLIIQLDQALADDGLSRLVALRGETGDTAWEVKRAVPCSWSSPIVVEHGGRWMVITCVNPWLIAYSPADGSELWRAKCLGGEVGPSPVCVDGVVYVANESSGMAAVRADGTGDVTETHIEWTTDIDVPDVCSPLATDKYVLLLAHGMLACFDRAAGASPADSSEPRQPLWEEDLQEEVSSSPSQVGNLVYLFSEEGKAWIIEPQADACKRVGEYAMGEPVRSSPAFQSGRIYIRGQEHLFCIGTK